MRRFELSMPVPGVFKRGYHKVVYSTWKLQEMAADEIMEIVSPQKHAAIKKKDKNPLYRAYVLAQEGYSEGKIVGEQGSMLKRWIGSAIKKIVNILKVGTKIFQGHEETNEHKGRMAIGEVVGKKLQQYKDKLSALVVVYIKKAFRNLPLDICSMEADISIDGMEGEKISSVNVDDITGIALGNSEVEQPGFPGAEMVVEFQAFIGQSQNLGGEVEKITIDEIKTLIKEERLKPSDLFGLEALTADPAVEGYVKDERKNASAGEYAHRKRTDDKFDEDRSDWDKKEKDMKEEIEKLTTLAAKSTVSDLFEKEAEKREFTERQEKFIKQDLDAFKVKDLDKVDAEFGEFLDGKVDEFEKIRVDVFGEEKKTEEQKKETKKTGGAEKGDEQLGDGVNPFLPSIEEVSD